MISQPYKSAWICTDPQYMQKDKVKSHGNWFFKWSIKFSEISNFIFLVAYQFVDIRFSPSTVSQVSMPKFLFYVFYSSLPCSTGKREKIYDVFDAVVKLSLPWNPDQRFVFWMSRLLTMFQVRWFSFLQTSTFYWKWKT